MSFYSIPKKLTQWAKLVEERAEGRRVVRLQNLWLSQAVSSPGIHGGWGELCREETDNISQESALNKFRNQDQIQ